MTEPTADELARWAVLVEAATPGPWAIEADGAAGFYGNADDYDVMHPLGDGRAEQVARGGRWEDGGPHVGACVKPDAEFIAAARTAVPRLLALVAAQADELALAETCVRVAAQRADRAEAKVADLEAAAEHWERVMVVVTDQAAEYVTTFARVRALCDETEHWYAILAGGNPSGATVGTSKVRAALDGTEATP